MYRQESQPLLGSFMPVDSVSIIAPASVGLHHPAVRLLHYHIIVKETTDGQSTWASATAGSAAKPLACSFDVAAGRLKMH